MPIPTPLRVRISMALLLLKFISRRKSITHAKISLMLFVFRFSICVLNIGQIGCSGSLNVHDLSLLEKHSTIFIWLRVWLGVQFIWQHSKQEDSPSLYGFPMVGWSNKFQCSMYVCVRICTCVRQPERIYSSADRRMLRFQFLLFFTARIRYDTVCSTIWCCCWLLPVCPLESYCSNL